MKKTVLLSFIMILMVMVLDAQNLEVEGKTKITVMDTVTDVSANVVRQSDGTLALRQYKVGDMAQGGIVFWVDETGEHGLACSQADLASAPGDSTHQWSAANATTGATGGTVPNGSSEGIVAGAMNTMLIVSMDRGDTDSAARLCADLVEGGYGDWYLPSKGELRLMFSNLYLAGIGNLASDFYWSSTELNLTSAWGQDFSIGIQANGFKNLNNRVRAVRAF